MANGAGNGTGGKKNGLRNGSGIATIEHSENKEKTQKEINIMSEIRKIENFAAPELDVYARLSEPQLLHYYEPQPGLFLAESPRVIERALDAGYEPVSFLAGSAELAANEALFAHCPDAPVYTAETKVLEQLTGFALTRGMLCAMHRRTLPAMEEICRNARRVAILENVVNPTNVGAIFRSAAALGIDAVLLTSGCSTRCTAAPSA